MPSEFFEKIVVLLHDTVLEKDARNTIREYCKLIGKTSDNLQPEDGRKLVMKLMSNSGERIPSKEYALLANRFEVFIKQNTTRHKGMVKGLLFDSVLDYVSFKKGSITVDGMKMELRLPRAFKPETWYPMDMLENILEKVERTMGRHGRARSRDIGDYVMACASFSGAKHMYGDSQMIEDSFFNLQEIFILDKFNVRKEECEIIVEFEGTASGNFHHFLMGIFDGIFKLRNISPSSMQEIAKGNGVAAISVRFEEGVGG